MPDRGYPSLRHHQLVVFCCPAVALERLHLPVSFHFFSAVYFPVFSGKSDDIMRSTCRYIRLLLTIV